MHAGSCLCGKVKFEVADRLKNIIHCHCSMCRKAHGAAYGSYSAAPARAFRFVEGHEAVATYRSSESVLRLFCRHCGSVLQWRDEARFKDWVSIPVGVLDTALDAASQQHAFVWSKAPWHTIKDDHRQHRYAAP